MCRCGKRPFASDPTAPLYSKLGSRAGFAHWTTSHPPPRKKRFGKKSDHTLAAMLTDAPFGPFPEHAEVNEPAPPSPRRQRLIVLHHPSLVLSPAHFSVQAVCA